MLAQVIRADRFGEPRDAFKLEPLPVPALGPHDVLVYVMAAGVNYNNVWAAMGIPIDVIKTRQKKGEPEDFHVGGSDASGVVWAIGADVTNVKVGDEVVVHCGMWDADDPHVVAGKDPMLAPTPADLGLRVELGQLRAVHEGPGSPVRAQAGAADVGRGGGVHARRRDRVPHAARLAAERRQPRRSGPGVGRRRRARARWRSRSCAPRAARPVAVVSGDEKNEFCKQLGAVGVIDRRKFDHWGKLPRWSDELEYGMWLKGARAFGAAFWEALGEKRNPAIVFEHPGETTLPTSCFMADTGGMIVICAGTTGYNATLDLRYHWMRQKRLQGSHFANDAQARGVNQLVDRRQGRAVSVANVHVRRDRRVSPAHARQPAPVSGNMAILVNAPRPGLRTLADVRGAAR